MADNILKIVNELRKTYKNDYIIQEGIVLNREFLADNGFLSAELRHHKKYYPIYIPGKHPIFGKNKVRYISDGDIYDSTSDVYNSFNYYEIGILMREDTPVTYGDKVRIFYNKSSNKEYATIYFEIISSSEKSNIIPNVNSSNVVVSNSKYVDSFSTDNKSVSSIAGGGKTKRGFYTPFSTMFSQLVGKIILLRNDKLALNAYSVAGQESSWHTGAYAKTGKEFSYGFFQMNTKVHTMPYIKEYIDTALKYFDIEDKYGIKLSDLSLSYSVDEWKLSVGFIESSNDAYPLLREQDVNYDVQLLVWYGYMIKRNYINNLSTIPVFNDINRYQVAQGFAKSLIPDYANNTKTYYTKYESERNKKYSDGLAYKNNVIQNPSQYTLPDEKYFIAYYS